MAVSRKALREQVKEQYMAKLMAILGEQEDVGVTAANEFNFPIVDAEGNEDFIVVKLVIPTGTRDGEPYDGYGAREDFAIKTKYDPDWSATRRSSSAHPNYTRWVVSSSR